MSVYDNISEIAKEHGMSVKDVAIKAHIGENSIYRWKKEKPSVKSLEKVANALNVSMVDLTVSNEGTPEYRAIQRKAKKLNSEQQNRLLKMMDLTFGEVFNENDH